MGWTDLNTGSMSRKEIYAVIYNFRIWYWTHCFLAGIIHKPIAKMEAFRAIWIINCIAPNDNHYSEEWSVLYAHTRDDIPEDILYKIKLRLLCSRIHASVLNFNIKQSSLPVPSTINVVLERGKRTASTFIFRSLTTNYLWHPSQERVKGGGCQYPIKRSRTNLV